MINCKFFFEGDDKKMTTNFSRRNFIKTSAAASLAAMASPMTKAFAAGSDKLRIGLVGAGSRGTGAAAQCVLARENVEVYAIADMFEYRVSNALKTLPKGNQWFTGISPESINVPKERQFVGFDAFQKLIDLDEIDIVLLATPPGFRPQHFAAAVKADKHVFMEKPVAVDPVGVRSVIESAQIAKEKRLSVVAGTHKRHQKHYLDIIKRIHDGQIGEVVAAQAYFNVDGILNYGQGNNSAWSEMEQQLRNWFFYTWLSGDHICEQHIHNLDIINWAFDGTPVKCMGMGGRQVRTAPEYGNVFDHFTVEYEYANGARTASYARQTDGCSGGFSERIVGTKGVVYLDSATGKITGEKPYTPEYTSPNPYIQEHQDLIDSIRNNEPLNEAVRIAESNMNAVMGRMSAYTGRALSWKWAMNSSKLDLRPEKYEFGPLKTDPVPVPGKTRLV